MWFLALADHPEWYRFGSHRGFVFTSGRFGQVGARFQTEEVFRGIRLTLRFELTGVNTHEFTFVLRRPVSSIYGYFRIDPCGVDGTDLELAVGSPQPCRRLLLRLPIIRGAIRRQIEREVGHVKQSMESLYGEETWAS